MKIFDQHIFEKAPEWVTHATRNAWGDVSYWAEKPVRSDDGLYFESKCLHRRVSSGFEMNCPKLLERLRHV